MSAATEKFDQAAELNPRIVLYIAPKNKSHSWTDWLIWIYGLDVWGLRYVSRRARLEMIGGAIMLTLVSLFDLCAWTLLFNVVLHTGQFDLSLKTSFALFLGGIFAMGTLVYERQFYTSDISLSAGPKKLLGTMVATAVRIGVLAIAAFATSQPMELLYFTGPINGRIHEESTRAYAAQVLRRWQNAEKKVETISDKEVLLRAGQRDPLGSQRRESAIANFKTMEEKRNRLDDLAKTTERQREGYRDALRRAGQRLQDAQTDAERAEARNAQQNAQSLLTSSQNALNLLANQIRDANGQVNSARAESSEADKEFRDVINNVNATIDETTRKAEAAQERDAEWLQAIRNSKPGAFVYEFGSDETSNVAPDKSPGRAYTDDGSYDFFQRLRILEDFRAALPPKWPPLSPTDLDQIGTVFKFRDQDADVSVKARRESEAKQFEQTYQLVRGIVFVIPLLIVAIKLLATAELKRYYSTAFQAAQLHPEALAFEAAVGRMEKLKRPWLGLRS